MRREDSRYILSLEVGAFLVERESEEWQLLIAAVAPPTWDEFVDAGLSNVCLYKALTSRNFFAAPATVAKHHLCTKNSSIQPFLAAVSCKLVQCSNYDDPPAHAIDVAGMSVLLETSLGEIVIDLLVDNAPKCCEK